MIPLRDNITSSTKPIFNWIFILINCYLFYIELHLKNSSSLSQFIFHWSVVPARLWAHPTEQAYTLVTATFLHGGWMHLIGNMLYLHIFGDNVEDRLGHVRFLALYLLGGLIAGMAQVAFNPHSGLPMVGASGAIAGVTGAYFLFFPHARIVTLVPIFIFIQIVELP